MRTLYFDCAMGAAGDMLTAALLELLPEPGAFLAGLDALRLPGIEYRTERVSKCGILGTQVSVLIHGHEAAGPADGHHHGEEHHPHTDLHSLRRRIASLPLSERVRQDVLAVYDLLAEAESAVHGVPVTDIHFHEVGTLDALADITAVCMLMDCLAPDEIVVSPIHVGSGQVRCAHGILPVPAPATAHLLKGVPICGGDIAGELCTPTGAALLKHFAVRFGPMPAMRVSAIGYGMGKKDFDRANCVRALLGETEERRGTVAVLSCNLDDMTAEELGFAMDRLFEQGALEVYTVPVGMKKNRPGTLLQVICSADDRERMAALIFRYTTTLGIREEQMDRYILDRSVESVQTPEGEVRLKRSEGFGVRRQKIEYDDLARIAREQDISLREARVRVERT